MFCVDEYLCQLIISMKDVFGDRFLYVGLQGSYLRGEATENSDIDVMVIINHLSVQDLDSYKEIIAQMEYYEKSCGFICGMEEFSKWNPLEICHLLHSTKDCYGKLAMLILEYSERDIINYIKVSLGNMYHEMCHRYIHADPMKNVLWDCYLPFCRYTYFFISIGALPFIIVAGISKFSLSYANQRNYILGFLVSRFIVCNFFLPSINGKSFLPRFCTYATAAACSWRADTAAGAKYDYIHI